MKAYKLLAVNDLRYTDCEIPEVPDGWALVEVKAAGICSSDIPRIFKKGTYHFPTIPGHEFSGIVRKVGNKSDKELIGKAVGVFPLIPCRECDSCKSGQYETCENYDYIGSRRDGGFAEYVSVPVWNLIPLNAGISFEAAAMLEPLSVAVHAVKRADIEKGEKAAVIGTGMIGFAAARLIKSLYGAEVCVIGHSEAKRKLAESIGVEYILGNEAKTGGFDTVIEAVGSEEAVNRAVVLTKAGGKTVFMGNPAGDICFTQDNYWRILRKQINVTGTWNSSYEKDKSSDWTDSLEAIASGKIEPEKFITHSFEQQELKKGLDLMLEHKTPYCKVMTLWNR